MGGGISVLLGRDGAATLGTRIMSGAWATFLIYLGIPVGLLLIGVVAEFVVFPAWRGTVGRLPAPWRSRVEIAPILTLIFAGIAFVVLLTLLYAPGFAALIGGSVVGIGTVLFIGAKGWRGGWRDAFFELTTALFIGFAVTLFIAALIVFLGGGHPVPLDERF